jgi:hypothetical protein
MLFYPAILFPPDSNGLSGCVVPDLLVNASGASPDAALRDAATIMAELLDGMARKGEPFPEPTAAEELDLDGGTLVLLAAPLPSLAA